MLTRLLTVMFLTGMFATNSMKKLLSIIAIVIVLAVAGWYFFFHKSILVTTPGNGGNPFGTAPNSLPNQPGTGGGTGGAGTDSTTTAATNVPVLFKVSSDPVAGAVIFANKDKREMIRYVDRASGHIYEVNPENLIKTEIENTTAPKVYDALWKADGSGVIIRTLASDEDTIKNTSLLLVPPKATTTGAEYSVAATDLRGSITSPVLSGTSLAYVLKDTGTIGISGFGGEKPTSVYTSAFTEWQLDWAGANLALTTNASRTADGFAYLLNVKSGSLTKILGPLTALTTKTSPDGSRIVYSYIASTGTSFNVENIKTKTTSPVLPVTLPEKCTWSAKKASVLYCGTPLGGVGAGEPDDWYRGVTHFADQIWKFDVDTGVAALLVEPKKAFGQSLDVINPEVSPNEDYLLFMNKTDLSLWALKLD